MKSNNVITAPENTTQNCKLQLSAIVRYCSMKPIGTLRLCRIMNKSG